MTKEDYAYYKAKGICVGCRKTRAAKGLTMCLDCLDNAKFVSEQTRSDESRKQRREYMKRKRELCIVFGVCRECMCRDATHGKKCVKCYYKANSKKQSKRDLYRSCGLCVLCGRERVTGYLTCTRCLEKCRANVKKRKKADSSNHYWRKLQSREVKYVKDYAKNVLKL